MASQQGMRTQQRQQHARALKAPCGSCTATRVTFQTLTVPVLTCGIAAVAAVRLSAGTQLPELVGLLGIA